MLPHNSTDLGLEVEGSTETKITTFSALVTLRVLDTSTMTKSIHTNIIDTSRSSHIDGVQEVRVRMTVMEFITDPREGTGTACLFLPSSQITKNIDILREDVLRGTDASNRRLLEIIVSPLSVRALTRDGEFIELAENITNLETFFEVIVLVGINKLQIFTTVECDSLVLVV